MASSQTDMLGEHVNIGNVKDTQKDHREPSDSFSTNPGAADADDVCARLERMELTEEETDELLREALEINKKLKAELKRQEDRSKGRRSRNRATPTDSRASTERYGILPPILPGESGLSPEQERLYGGRLRPHISRTPQRTGVLSGKSRERVTISATVGSHSKASAKTSRISQSADKRSSRHSAGKQPEWNDRFSYT